MGIETVAVYSEADKGALHLRYADETVCIGPAPSTRSYLDIPSLIAAVEIADVGKHVAQVVVGAGDALGVGHV